MAWQEGGRYPDLVVELLSPSTAHIDRGIKRDRYERILRIPEYYLYKPGDSQFQAFNLDITGSYQEPAPNEHGWVWSHQLGVWVGLWHGTYENTPDFTWLRSYDTHGCLIPTKLERLQRGAPPRPTAQRPSSSACGLCWPDSRTRASRLAQMWPTKSCRAPTPS